MPRVVKGRGWKSVAGWATGAALTAAWLAGAFLPVTGSGISKAKNQTAAMPRKASKPKRTRGRGIGKTLKRVALAAVPAAAAALAYRHFTKAPANAPAAVPSPRVSLKVGVKKAKNKFVMAKPRAIPKAPPLPPAPRPQEGAKLPFKRLAPQLNTAWYALKRNSSKYSVPFAVQYTPFKKSSQ